VNHCFCVTLGGDFEIVLVILDDFCWFLIFGILPFINVVYLLINRILTSLEYLRARIKYLTAVNDS